MTEPAGPMTVNVSWDTAQEFTCQAGKHEIGLDGASYSAPSPMQLLAVALTGCLAIDVVHILQKRRHELTALEVRFTGERAPDPPRRFVRITLNLALTTDATPDQVERAIQLSRQTYCSVWNTLRPDTELDVTCTIDAPE